MCGVVNWDCSALWGCLVKWRLTCNPKNKRCEERKWDPGREKYFLMKRCETKERGVRPPPRPDRCGSDLAPHRTCSSWLHSESHVVAVKRPGADKPDRLSARLHTHSLCRYWSSHTHRHADTEICCLHSDAKPDLFSKFSSFLTTSCEFWLYLRRCFEVSAQTTLPKASSPALSPGCHPFFLVSALLGATWDSPHDK